MDHTLPFQSSERGTEPECTRRSELLSIYFFSLSRQIFTEKKRQWIANLSQIAVAFVKSMISIEILHDEREVPYRRAWPIALSDTWEGMPASLTLRNRMQMSRREWSERVKKWRGRAMEKYEETASELSYT